MSALEKTRIFIKNPFKQIKKHPYIVLAIVAVAGSWIGSTGGKAGELIFTLICISVILFVVGGYSKNKKNKTVLRIFGYIICALSIFCSLLFIYVFFQIET